MPHGLTSNPPSQANFRQLPRQVIAFRRFISSIRWPAHMDRSRFSRVNLSIPPYINEYIGGDPRAVSAKYFESIHVWMPLISKKRFYDYLMNPSVAAAAAPCRPYNPHLLHEIDQLVTREADSGQSQDARVSGRKEDPPCGRIGRNVDPSDSAGKHYRPDL